MLTVHHLENSRSQRILWLLEELGLEYEVKRYERDPKTLLAPAALKKIHPLGKSPVVTDGDRVYAESGAILENILARYGNGRLVPERGTDAHDRYVYWMHYAEGSAMSPLLLKLVFERVATAPVPFFVRPVVKQIAKKVNDEYIDRQIALQFGWIEKGLEEHAWFAGDEMTGADIQMSFPLESVAARRAGVEGPRTRAFVKRIQERPAYQRALEKGGPYELFR